MASAARAFVRQSPYSDYCAVYATATWLGLRSGPVSRRQALRWFGVRPSNWAGASHARIAEVVAAHRPEDAGRWRSVQPSTPQQLQAELTALLPRGPLLVTAMCELRRPRVRCRHAFVVTACADERVELLDPLGRPPRGRKCWNAWLDIGDRRRCLVVYGAGWLLDLHHRVWLFVPHAERP